MRRLSIAVLSATLLLGTQAALGAVGAAQAAVASDAGTLAVTAGRSTNVGAAGTTVTATYTTGLNSPNQGEMQTITFTTNSGTAKFGSSNTATCNVWGNNGSCSAPGRLTDTVNETVIVTATNATDPTMTVGGTPTPFTTSVTFTTPPIGTTRVTAPTLYVNAGDTSVLTADYQQGTASGSSGSQNQTITFTITGAPTFVDGTKAASCVIAAPADTNTCSAPTLSVPTMQNFTVTAMNTTDTSVPSSTLSFHVAGLFFTGCSQTDLNKTSTCATQVAQGVTQTGSFTYLQEGTPIANANVTMNIGWSGSNNNQTTFTLTQPAGTQTQYYGGVTCVTDRAGKCFFTYRGGAAASQSVVLHTYLQNNLGSFSQSNTNRTAMVINTVAPSGTVAITGDAVVRPDLNTVQTVTGTAPANTTVTLNLRRASDPAGTYPSTRDLTTDANGRWTTDLLATADLRYYATVGTATSNSVLLQVNPTMWGESTRTMARNETYVLRGNASPGSTVFLAFHKLGTPVADYSIVRQVTADANGLWTRPILANTDYRLFITRTPTTNPSGQTIYLLQAR